MPKKSPPKKVVAKKPAPKKTAKPVVATKKVVVVPKKKILVKKPVLVPSKKVIKPASKVIPAKAGSTPKGVKVAPKVPAKVDPKLQQAKHAKQKQTLDNHRKDTKVKVEEVIVAPVRQKLQFFTIENVHQFLKSRKKEGTKLNLWVPDEERKARERAASSAREKAPKIHNIETASIADLLGGVNPFRKGSTNGDESKQVPEKLRRYYHLLIAMREVIQKGLAFHSEEALKKNGKEDAGDLSGYSQHMADAGSDTADRDFALSLISNEQEALKEISDAIARMKKNIYGICEITNKPIPHARLMAVPFTRYSLEGQKELERNRRASRRRGGNPLGEIGDEVGFGTGGGGGEDDTPET